MTGNSVLFRWVLLSAVTFGCGTVSYAQTPLPSDVPAKYDAPKTNYDYVKRVEMIPMRDGVKLYTVIVVPKGAKNAPILLTRTPYDAAHRAARNQSAHMLAILPQGDEVFVADGYIRVFQDVRGKYGSEGDYVMTRPLRGPLNPSDGGSLDRCLRHDRLAGEKCSGVERQGGNDRQLVRGLHGGDGAGQSASGAESRRAR